MAVVGADLLIESCLVFLIFNANLASGKKKKVVRPRESNSGEIDEWIPEDEPKPDNKSPKTIDFRGTVRQSLAMHMASADPTRNTVCSPISALLPLGKLVLGATGKTETELLQAIGHTRDELKPALKKLIDSLKQLPGVTLTVASRIYISQQTYLDPQFLKESKQIFHSAVEKADFSNRKETVRVINDWVKRHTNNMIPNLLSPSDVPMKPSLILVNAVYFQGNWMEPFRSLGALPFHSPMGTRRVPMMTVTGTFNYANDESLSAQILELPYANENASFVVVLPHDKNGLPMLLTALKLAPKLLNKAMKDKFRRSVEVQLPKFKVTSKINLKDLFKKIGLKSIFLNLPDLNKIVVDQFVHVSAAIQEAVLEVTEIGTEAAAGTAVISALAGSPSKFVKFTADHPFLFFVLAKEEQLFAGTYTSV